MRIINGILKGKRINVPKGFPSRPTTDYAKEGLFNILQNKISFNDISVLDLCAGTGNISFEFISRGVNFVLSVDANSKCIKHIDQKIYEFNIQDKMRTYKSDCILFCNNSTLSFDLIFADLPFTLDIHDQLLKTILNTDILNENGRIILEHGPKVEFSSHAQYSFCRKFGNVVFSFFNF